MAIEKKWEAIAPRLFTSNGTADGLVTVASTDRFKVKQSIIIKNNLGANKTLEVKRVPSETQLYVGAPGNIDARENISAFTVADGSTIEAPLQPRATIPDKEFERASYEEEPTVAKRVVLVDALGRKYDMTNPLPTNATFEGSLTVNLNGTGVGGDTVGLVGVGGDRLIVNADGSITVKDPLLLAALNQVVTILQGTVNVSDADTHTALTTANGLLSNIFTKLNTGTLKVDDDETQGKLDTAITALGNILAQVSENIRTRILAATDRLAQYQFADSGTKNQRVTRVDYTASTVGSGPGFTARKNVNYVLAGTRYVVDSIQWSLV